MDTDIKPRSWIDWLRPKRCPLCTRPVSKHVGYRCIQTMRGLHRLQDGGLAVLMLACFG